MTAHARCQSFLGTDIDQFLAHKRSLGRRYDVEEKTLALFDAYLTNNRIGELHELTPARVDQFLLSRPRSRPRSYNHRKRCLDPTFRIALAGGVMPGHEQLHRIYAPACKRA